MKGSRARAFIKRVMCYGNDPSCFNPDSQARQPLRHSSAQPLAPQGFVPFGAWGGSHHL
jgi:hypothetical protein